MSKPAYEEHGKQTENYVRIPNTQLTVRVFDKKLGPEHLVILDPNEIQAYIDYVNKKLDDEHAERVKQYPDYTAPRMPLQSLDIAVDGEFVDLTWTQLSMPFSRIRRITGYLVGDMSRWNNAKRCEEGDRVKHDITQPAQPEVL